MRLATTLEASHTAGWFAGEVCQRWQLDALAETARSLAGELVSDAIFADRSDLKMSSCAQVGCSSPFTAALPTWP